MKAKAAADGGHCRAGLQQRRLDGHCCDACGRAGIDAVAQCCRARRHIGRRFERVELPLTGALRGWGVTPIDIDNDGWIDLAAIVETSAGPQVKVFRNRGDGSFEDVSHALGLDSVKLTAPRGLIAADVDGDGAPDLIVTQENAPPVLLRNVGANKNHFVRLDLTGYADNKTAIGIEGGDIRQRPVAEVGAGRRVGLPDPGSAADSRRAGRG